MSDQRRYWKRWADIPEDIKDLCQNADGRPVVVVDIEVFQDLIQERVDRIRKRERDSVCDIHEAIRILNCSHNTFYKMIKHPDCVILKGPSRGTYIEESIFEELERRKNLGKRPANRVA